MPLYEYECKECHRRLEKIQSFNAPPEKICPHCGGELERVISAPALQFKGAGWYVNDYAKSGGKSASASNSDAGSKSAASGEAKSSESIAGAKSSGDSAASGSSSSESSSTTSTASKAKSGPASS